jgi:hypothetical protein
LNRRHEFGTATTGTTIHMSVPCKTPDSGEPDNGGHESLDRAADSRAGGTDWTIDKDGTVHI